jgi:hypothetical protein
LRFWNNDVFQNLEGVWQLIFDAMHEAGGPPPPPPPPAGGGV